MTETDIVKIVRKCESWSQPIDTGSKYGRWEVHVSFENEDDAKAFAVEMMMVTSGQEPYGDPA